MSKTNPNPYPQLGVDFDNAGYPAQLRENAALKVGDTRARLDWTTSRVSTVQASFINGLSQGNNPATTYTFMVFPQVTPNKIWNIMRIGVTAPDPFATLAGVTVLAFRNSTIPQDSNVEPTTFGDLIAVLGAVPNTTYPAFNSVVTRMHERVVLAFKGLAVSQSIQATMDIIEHDLQAYMLSLVEK